MSESLRIGDVARLVGTTPRTIRYYEEIGLLPEASSRESGAHRTYSETDVERLREAIRLRDLLGITLDELKTLIAAEEARAAVRTELARDDIPDRRREELVVEALGHIEHQLELVRRRASELRRLEDDLTDKRRRARRKLRELAAKQEGAHPPEAAAAGAAHR